MNLRKTIGSNVATLRKGLNLNQSQLAELLKVNKQTVYRIEAGTTNVGVDTLSALARALGVEPAMLVVTTAANPRGGRSDKRIDQVIECLRRALNLAQTFKTYQA